MGYSTGRAKMESELAAAHRRLWTASEAAQAMGDLGAAEDIDQILREVSRVASASLTSKARRPKHDSHLVDPA